MYTWYSLGQSHHTGPRTKVDTPLPPSVFSPRKGSMIDEIQVCSQGKIYAAKWHQHKALIQVSSLKNWLGTWWGRQHKAFSTPCPSPQEEELHWQASFWWPDLHQAWRQGKIDRWILWGFAREKHRLRAHYQPWWAWDPLPWFGWSRAPFYWGRGVENNQAAASGQSALSRWFYWPLLQGLLAGYKKWYYGCSRRFCWFWGA